MTIVMTHLGQEIHRTLFRAISYVSASTWINPAPVVLLLFVNLEGMLWPIPSARQLWLAAIVGSGHRERLPSFRFTLPFRRQLDRRILSSH